MTSATDRLQCERCQNPVDLEDLFCDFCGLAIERKEGEDDQPLVHRIKDSFAVTLTCRQCGATVRYDEKVAAPRCAFCGSRKVDESQPTTEATAPELIVTFAIDSRAAERQIRDWLGRGFFRPNDLVARAELSEMRPLFLPYWLFNCRARVLYAADTDNTPSFARASWCPSAGSFDEQFENLMVAASGGITSGELTAISPFDFSAARPFDVEALAGAALEEIAISRKRARGVLVGVVEDAAAVVAAGLLPGRKNRNLHVKAIVRGAVSTPIALPVWIAAYRYRERPYRVVINGQSGSITGSAPFSVLKLLAVIAACIVGGITLLAGLAAFSS